MNRIPKTPSYIGHFLVQLNGPKEASQLPKLKKIIKRISKRARLKPTGDMSVLKVDSPIPGYPSYGLTQQLLTSCISVDAWPEQGRVLILLHSCLQFNPQEIAEEILIIYPDGKMLSQRFSDWSYGEG